MIDREKPSDPNLPDDLKYVAITKSTLPQELAGATIATIAGFFDNYREGLGENFIQRCNKVLGKFDLGYGEAYVGQQYLDKDGNPGWDDNRPTASFAIPVVRDKNGDFGITRPHPGIVDTSNLQTRLPTRHPPLVKRKL